MDAVTGLQIPLSSLDPSFGITYSDICSDEEAEGDAACVSSNQDCPDVPSDEGTIGTDGSCSAPTPECPSEVLPPSLTDEGGYECVSDESGGNYCDYNPGGGSYTTPDCDSACDDYGD
jgi:hypothetical protein